MRLLRWWREWRNPTPKCERVGHRLRRQSRRVLVKPERVGYFGGVADSAIQERTACTRCGHVEEAPEIVSRRTIHSLSMPAERYDRFDRDGIYPETRWRSDA